MTNLDYLKFNSLIIENKIYESIIKCVYGTYKIPISLRTI